MSSDDIINEVYEEARKERSERFYNSMVRGIHPQPSFAGLNEMEMRNLRKGETTNVKRQLKNKMNEIHKVITGHNFSGKIGTKVRLYNLIDEVDDLINNIKE